MKARGDGDLLAAWRAGAFAGVTAARLPSASQHLLVDVQLIAGRKDAGFKNALELGDGALGSDHGVQSNRSFALADVALEHAIRHDLAGDSVGHLVSLDRAERAKRIVKDLGSVHGFILSWVGERLQGLSRRHSQLIKGGAEPKFQSSLKKI